MSIEHPRFAPPLPESRRSNLPLLFIASAFLCVTVVLALLQPSLTTEDTDAPVVADIAPEPEPAPTLVFETQQPTIEEDLSTAPIAQLENTEEETINAPLDVTRTRPPSLTQTPTIPQKAYRNMAARITDHLRRPVRLTDTGTAQPTLDQITTQTLAAFTTDAAQPVDPDLVRVIVDSVSQKQSDAYIHVILNTGAARGRFDIPQALRTASGGFDANALLHAMAEMAGSPPAAFHDVATLSGMHSVGVDDSLAGLAHMYLGQAMGYVSLLQANPEISATNPVLSEGQKLRVDSF